jgi:hypothetical protein
MPDKSAGWQKIWCHGHRRTGGDHGGKEKGGFVSEAAL